MVKTMTTADSYHVPVAAGGTSGGKQRKIASTRTEGHARSVIALAHELREPLSSILLAASALSDSASDESTHREMCSLIERQGRYLARLIDRTLQADHHGAGQLKLHKEWFDLKPLVRDAVEAVTPMLKGNDHQLDISMPTEPLYLMADAMRAQQVLVNLLANAAKYTPPGGSICLRVEVCEEQVIIEVRDNGIGMVSAVLKRIFNLYEQGPSCSPSPGYRGLGVGLSLVKSLVELHGGTIQAFSDGAGAGSSFVVKLPVSGEAQVQTQTSDGHPWLTSAMLDA